MARVSYQSVLFIGVTDRDFAVKCNQATSYYSSEIYDPYIVFFSSSFLPSSSS